jgi:hypothetical protein
MRQAGAAGGLALSALGEARGFGRAPPEIGLFVDAPTPKMAKGQAVGLEKGHVVSKRTLAARPGARKGVRFRRTLP